MNSDDAVGALCIMVSFGVLLLTGEIFLSICSLGLLYVFLKITGN